MAESSEIPDKHSRIIEIGGEIHADGGDDAIENFSFVLKNRISQEIEKDPSPLLSLWNGLASR